MKKVAVAVLSVFAFIILIIVVTQHTSTNETNSNTGSTYSSSVPVPTEESRFTSTVESFVGPYRSADTEIRKTNVRFERRNSLQSFFLNSAQGFTFHSWVGKVNKLTTERDGEAYVSIKLPNSDVVLETMNISIGDGLSFSRTMISRYDPVYPSLMQLHIGDEVRISGQFLRSEKPEDFVEEESVTEEGSMTEPGFIVRFSSIKLLSDSDPQVSAPSPMQDAVPASANDGGEPSQESDAPAPTPAHRPVIVRNGRVISGTQDPEHSVTDQQTQP